MQVDIEGTGGGMEQSKGKLNTIRLPIESCSRANIRRRKS